MSHKLTRLLSELQNKPHLISVEGFNNVTSYLELRNTGLAGFKEPSESPKKKEKFFDTSSGVAVIEMFGSLVYRDAGFDALCGVPSYEGTIKKVDEALANGIKTIVLEIDSHGGVVQGCFDTANEVRALCDEHGASLLTFIDGTCASAAYAWGCISDEVVATKYSSIGSIGVVIGLTNYSEADKKAGITTVYITDGVNKVPFAEDGSFKQEFLDKLDSEVKYLGDEFRSHVSSYTGLSTEDLKKTKAETFLAEEALSLGLINKIMTKVQFVDYVMNNMKGK